jgi:sec-independent protein translocase protein TatC
VVTPAIITPPDIISQIGLAVPLILLYEISIIVATLMLRSQKKREEAAAAATKT